AGLEASTLTPGRMPPDESLTVPATAPCEKAGVDSNNTAAMTTNPVARTRIDGLLSGRDVREGRMGEPAPSLWQRRLAIKRTASPLLVEACPVFLVLVADRLQNVGV